MKDIRFDFPNNDVAVVDGDFAITEDPSVQNATLILLKNPVNTMSAQWGVGFEVFALNAAQGYVYALAAEARRQVLKDGADSCTITVRPGAMFGDYDVAVDAQYPMLDTPASPVEYVSPTPPPPGGRTIDLRIAFRDSAGNNISGIDARVDYTLSDGKQSIPMAPSDITQPDGSDLYIFYCVGATTGTISYNITAVKSGYQTGNFHTTSDPGDNGHILYTRYTLYPVA